MRPRSRSALALAIFAAALAVPACGGDSDEGLGGDDDSLAGMLDQVPASGSMRDQVIYGNLARLREAAGIETPTGDSESYARELMDAVTTGWTVAEPFRSNALTARGAVVGQRRALVDDLLRPDGRARGPAGHGALHARRPWPGAERRPRP